jgi:hypothetical protein
MTQKGFFMNLIRTNQTTTPEADNKLYVLSMPQILTPVQRTWMRIRSLSITVVFTILGFAAPGLNSLYHKASFWHPAYALVALYGLVCAWAVVEEHGFNLHRYVQHLGFLSKQFKVMMEVVREHKEHHVYINGLANYIRSKYVGARKVVLTQQAAAKRAKALKLGETPKTSVTARQSRTDKVLFGILLVVTSSWYITGFAIAVLFGLLHGFANPATWSFVVGLGVYGTFISKTHDRFHYPNSWEKYRWFQAAKEEHFRHHLTERGNYGIHHMLMDKAKGTYIDKTQFAGLTDQNLLDLEVTINFGDVLLNYTPEERAEYVMGFAISGHAAKLEGWLNTILRVLRSRLQFHPNCARAQRQLHFALLAQEDLKQAIGAG